MLGTAVSFIHNPVISWGTKCNLTNINENKIHLQAMTAWSIEPMDITRLWLSSFVGLYCSGLLLLVCGSFCLKFSVQEVKSVLERVDIRWLGHWRIFHFFASLKYQVALAVCFRSLSICTVPSTWLNLCRRCGFEHLRILPTASVLCHIINKY